MRHLIDPLDFTKEETQKLLDLADRIHDDPEAYQDVADRKRLATLFYEPSTRTRLSFESAMLRLGGKVLGFPEFPVLPRVKPLRIPSALSAAMRILPPCATPKRGPRCALPFTARSR